MRFSKRVVCMDGWMDGFADGNRRVSSAHPSIYIFIDLHSPLSPRGVMLMNIHTHTYTALRPYQKFPERMNPV